MASDVPVTIVGGGPVGLSMALVLGRFGIRSRVIEQAATTTDHPKARGVWPRAMEIFRQWGVEQAIRRGGLQDETDAFVVLETMDKELGRSWPEPFHDEGPARKSVVAQDIVEEALAAKLKEFSEAQVLWSTRAVEALPDDSGVTITVEDIASGARTGWRSDYLIGADGGAGFSAKAAGIAYEGPPQLALMLNTYFRADLSRFQAAKDAAGLIFAPQPGDTEEPFRILNTNAADRWLLLRRIGTDRDERPVVPSEAETIASIRHFLQLPDLNVEIINEGVWRLTRRIASRFSAGRIFLVGDAAHRFPPTGGFGMNSGIQDVHNLGWKLAYVLQGKARPNLLSSYDLERRPIANANADLALNNLARFGMFLKAVGDRNPDKLEFWLRDMDNHTNSIGHTLGFIYDDGAVVPDGSTRPPYTPRMYTPTDRPGSRFPHWWLDKNKKISSLDLFDKDFVLMFGRDGHSWAEAARALSKSRGIPIDTYEVGDLDPALGVRLGKSGAALVRPDGVTAWRVAWPEDDPEAVLGDVLDRILQ